MFLYGTDHAYRGNWWLLPTLGAFASLAAICVAPAGAAEIWSVMVKGSTIEEAEQHRHKAGVVTAWIVAGAIAIAVLFVLPASWRKAIGYGALVLVAFWQIDNYIGNKLRGLESAAEARDARLNKRIDDLQREISRLNGEAQRDWNDDSY